MCLRFSWQLIGLIHMCCLSVLMISETARSQDTPPVKKGMLQTAIRALFGSTSPKDKSSFSEYECLEIVGDALTEKEMTFFEGNWTSPDQNETMTSKVLPVGIIKVADVAWNAKKQTFLTSIGTFQIRKVGKELIGYWQSQEDPDEEELKEEVEPNEFDPEKKETKNTIGFARVRLKDNCVFISFAKSERFTKDLLIEGKLQIDRLKEVESEGKFQDCFEDEIELARKLLPLKKSK